MEEPGGLQSVGLPRVGHDWVTSLSLSPFMHGRGKWRLTPVFLPGESQGRGSLVGYGVAQSRTWLKQLSSSSSSSLVAQTVKKSACNRGDLGSIPGLWRFLEGGHGNPFQYCCLENPHGQRSKELYTTEQLSQLSDWAQLYLIYWYMAIETQ